MAIKITRNRDVEVDDKGHVWAFNTEEFVNGDNQPTVRKYSNRIKPKDLKVMEKELREDRERLHKNKSHLENFEVTINSKEYKEFEKQIKEGDLKNHFDCYVQKKFLEEKIKTDKNISSIKSYLNRELDKLNEMLDEDNQKELQIKKIKELLK